MIDTKFLSKLSKQAGRQGAGHKERTKALPAREWKIIIAGAAVFLAVGSVSIWSIYNSFSKDVGNVPSEFSAPVYPRQVVEEVVSEYRELNENYRAFFSGSTPVVPDVLEGSESSEDDDGENDPFIERETEEPLSEVVEDMTGTTPELAV